MEENELEWESVRDFIKNPRAVIDTHPYFASLYMKWGNSMDPMPQFTNQDVCDILGLIDSYSFWYDSVKVKYPPLYPSPYYNQSVRYTD